MRLWRPGGYLRFTLGLRWVYVGSTLGLPWVYLRSTLGLPWVISLAISGRFLLIFAESLTKRKGRKFFFDDMVDFPIGKRYVGGRVR